MACYHPFVLLILVLYFVAFVCANGVVKDENVNDMVHEVQTAAKKTLKNAEGKLRNAESILEDIEGLKESAKRATAAAAEEAVNGSHEIKVIAQKANIALEELLELLPNATKETQNIIHNMKLLLERAKQLNAKAQREIWIETDISNDSSKTKENAKDIKTKLEALDNEITTASSPLKSWPTQKYQMSNLVKSAQVAKYQIDGIVAFSKFETLVKSAENDIKLAENKRDEINTIVQQMKNIYDNTTSDLRQKILSLHSTAENNLLRASSAVENAKEINESMLSLRLQANSTLVNVETATNVLGAMREVRNLNWVFQEVEKKVKEIKQAVQSAMTYADNAQLRKDEATNLINNQNEKPDVEHDREETNSQDSTKPQEPLQITKESPKESETIKPTTINIMESPVSEGTDTKRNTINGPKENEMMKPQITTKDHTESKESVKETIVNPTWSEVKEPTITNPNKAVSEGKEHTEDTKESPTESETIKPTTRNSDESMNEQDMDNTTESPVVRGTRQPTITNPNKPVSRGTVPTRHDQSDSAMTVPVPLILALIAFAVLN